MRTALRTLCTAGVLAVSSVPAMAHHSVAMFDLTKTETVSGTVKVFQYTNPHAWLYVMVEGAAGAAPVLYGFESEGPSALRITGVKVSTFEPGDKVTVVTHPMRDRPGGLLVSVTTADGHVYTIQQLGSSAKLSKPTP